MGKKLLFICTGNTCRSPMAAGLMNLLLGRAGLTGYCAESAGFAANPGDPASRNAVEAMAEIGVDLKPHRARRAAELDLSSYEAVYVMDEGKKRMLAAAFPQIAEKVKSLGNGVPDPFGGSLDDYRRCRNSMAAALRSVVDGLRRREAGGGNVPDREDDAGPCPGGR